MRRSTLKKLIKHSCIKTAFLFDDKIYKHVDGVSIGLLLEPVLANIIMTEFERLVLDKVIKDGLIKFYIRYVDDTLVKAEVEDIDNIIKQFNSFDKSIQFTIDRFEDGIAHFLDIKINGSETDLYYKTTHTGQYCDFFSHTPWKLKIYWIKAIYDRVTKICSSNKLLDDQINQIRTFMSSNSYPKYVRNSIIKRLQQKKSTIQKNDENLIKIWIRLAYIGNKGKELIKTCILKLKRCFKTHAKFSTLYDAKKCVMFCSVKDKILTNQKSNAIYTIKCFSNVFKIRIF